MKAYTLILFILLLLGLGAVIQVSSQPGLAAQVGNYTQSSGAVSAQYVVLPGTASAGSYRLDNLRRESGEASSGGRYQLTGRTQAAGELANGGKYHLLSPAAPQLTGAGCCCMYLPCVRK